MNHVAIIGSGFSGLSTACFLAKAGFDVSIFEKNASPGGRARKFEQDGFNFDMGPSWYWMPDVFDRFFSHFNKKTSEYYKLIRLDPSYQVVFGSRDKLLVPAGLGEIHKLFESLEPGGSDALTSFLREAKVKYDIAMNDLVFKPGLSISEFMSVDLLRSMLKLKVFESISSHIKHHFKSQKLVQLLEFPVLFLGAKPSQIPSLYSLMNYADIQLGTWYPMGGMYKVVEAMVTLAKELGVTFHFNHCVSRIEATSDGVSAVIVDNRRIPVDYLVASADYHHVEQELLPEPFRRYSSHYWNKQVMAPSALIYYLGIKGKVPGLHHHNLFFDSDFRTHAREIYDDPKWPTSPQFYVCCPSKTDPTVAPESDENIFILIPTAPGLQDTPLIRDTYFEMAMNRIEHYTRPGLRDRIILKRSYAHTDFIADYNAFKGNAYGLANTLRQTANLKPSIINKKLRNLFYTGQLTVPGPGVPPAIISGQVVANQLIKTHREVVTS